MCGIAATPSSLRRSMVDQSCQPGALDASMDDAVDEKRAVDVNAFPAVVAYKDALERDEAAGPLVTLMKRCWAHFPAERPTFIAICAELEARVAADERAALGRRLLLQPVLGRHLRQEQQQAEQDAVRRG